MRTILVAAAIAAVAATFFLTRGIEESPHDQGSPVVISGRGFMLADGSWLKMPPTWADTFGFSFYYPEMKPAHWLDGRPARNKFYVPSIERVDDVDAPPTPVSQLKRDIEFSGSPKISSIRGGDLLRASFPNPPRSHPGWHLPDDGTVVLISREEAPYYAVITCSASQACDGDVLIKRTGRQYRIIFNGTNEASNVLKATNALISSWVTRSD